MILSCKNISKSFGIDLVLNNINFQIEEKEKIAITGVNGAGKSTLFKILAGEISADSGEIYTAKDAVIGYLPQNTEIDSNNTIFDEMLLVFSEVIELESNLHSLEKEMSILKGDELAKLMDKYSLIQHQFEELNGYAYKSQIKGVLKGLGFNEEQFYQPISQLSGGQKTRVALAKLLLSSPSILLLDEPTNHLDITAIEWLEDFLKNYPNVVIIISHDRYFLDKLVSKVIEIENTQATIYNGNYSFYAKQKQINREIHLKQYLNQQKEIKRQEQIIQTLRSFNREKSLKRAKSREKALEKIDRIKAPDSLPSSMKFSLEAGIESGNDVLHVKKLSKSFADKSFSKMFPFN